MTFNFDIQRIGKNVAHMRCEHNMTRMALADEMGVSFQAVSNWERGQSMPDISKLPELAELFGTTIDALLGRHAPLIEKAAEGKLDELAAPTVEEVAEAAPLLPPKQMDDLTNRLLELPNRPDMTELLPFFPTNKVDELLRQEAARDGKLLPYAVHASTAAVDELALALEQQGKSSMPLLSLLSNTGLNAIIAQRLKKGQSITSLLPFLSQETIQHLFDAASTKD